VLKLPHEIARNFSMSVMVK